MRLRDIIPAEKANVSVSTWTNDKPKKKDFPLSCKGGGVYPLTRKWRWVVVEFDASGEHFRILVAYHVDLPEYQATLGHSKNGDTRVLARVEYHGNHPQPGWHVHASCDELALIGFGMMKPLGQTRIPGVHDRHRRKELSLNDDSMNDNIALDIAAQWFRFKHQTSMEFDA